MYKRETKAIGRYAPLRPSTSIPHNSTSTTLFSSSYTLFLMCKTNPIRMLEVTMLKKFGPENLAQHYAEFDTICDATQVWSDLLQTHMHLTLHCTSSLYSLKGCRASNMDNIVYVRRADFSMKLTWLLNALSYFPQGPSRNLCTSLVSNHYTTSHHHPNFPLWARSSTSNICDIKPISSLPIF